jgi:hypothetical protein
MFAYNHEDKKRMQDKIRKKRTQKLYQEAGLSAESKRESYVGGKPQEDILFSFEETL